MFRKVALAAAILTIASGGTAAAHPKLTAASPPVRGQVALSPKTLRLSFNEQVLPNFSGLVIKDSAGKAIKTRRPSVDRSDNKILIVPLAAAQAPGVYHVEWHAVSTDTHRVTGQYEFTIG